MSNKVDISPGYANDQFGNDLNNWFRAGFYQTVGGSTTNVPPDCDGWGIITIFNAMATSNSWAVQIFQPANTVGSLGTPLFYRFWNNGWSSWEPIATATPPQEYDLPITQGYVSQLYRNTYYKTQDGIVHVSFCIQKAPETAFIISEVFAILPVGFRPAFELARDVGGDGIDLGTGIIATEIHIKPNGEMYIWGANGGIDWVYGEVTFLAAVN